MPNDSSAFSRSVRLRGYLRLSTVRRQCYCTKQIICLFKLIYRDIILQPKNESSKFVNQLNRIAKIALFDEDVIVPRFKFAKRKRITLWCYIMSRTIISASLANTPDRCVAFSVTEKMSPLNSAHSTKYNWRINVKAWS